MATIADLKQWIHRDLGQRMSVGMHFQLLNDESTNADGGQHRIQLVCFTEANEYSIRAVEGWGNQAKSYLGCIASSRKRRPGEHWHRCNDLPDGPLTEETWHRIVCAMLAYELQEVHNDPAVDFFGTTPVGEQAVNVA